MRLAFASLRRAASAVAAVALLRVVAPASAASVAAAPLAILSLRRTFHQRAARNGRLRSATLLWRGSPMAMTSCPVITACASTMALTPGNISYP